MNLYLKKNVPYPDQVKQTLTYKLFTSLQKIAPGFSKNIFTNLVYLLNLRKVINNFDYAIIEHTEGKIVFANHAFYKIFGYTEKDIIGKDIKILFPDNQLNYIQQRITAKYQAPYETVLKNSSGLSFPVEIHAFNISTKRRIAFLNDITKRLTNQIALNIYHEKPNYLGFSFTADLALNIASLNFSKDDYFYGFSKEEMLGKNLKSVATPESYKVIEQKMGTVLKRYAESGQVAEKSYSLEIKIIAKSGEEIDLLLAYSIYKTTNGAPLLVIGLAQDITEQRRMERALVLAQEHARMTKDAKFTVDKNGSFLYHNKNTVLLLGYPPSTELTGHNYRELTVKEDIPRVFKLFNEIWRNKDVEYEQEFVDWRIKKFKSPVKKNTVQAEDFFGLVSDHTALYAELIAKGFLTKSGHKTKDLNSCKNNRLLFQLSSRFYKHQEDILDMLLNDMELLIVEANVAKHYDQNNHKIGFSGTLTDITKKKKDEYELAKIHEEYRLIAENSADIIWIYDLQLEKLTFISPSVKKLRGMTVEEALEQSPFEAISEDDVPKLKNLLNEVIEEVKSGKDATTIEKTIEYLQKTKEGSFFWAEMKVNFICNKEGIPIKIQGITRDISDRKKEQEKAKKNALYDKTTGLPGYNYFFDNMETIISKAVRAKTKIAVIVADLNNLKIINDTFGHQAGDACLKAFGTAIKHGFRTYDLVGRTGGDEFMCAIPDISKNEISIIMERIENELISTNIDLGEGNNIKGLTTSIGCLIYDPSEMSLERIDTAEEKYEEVLFKVSRNHNNDITIYHNEHPVLSFNTKDYTYEEYLEFNYQAVKDKKSELFLIRKLLGKLKTYSDQLYGITDKILYEAKEQAKEEAERKGKKDQYGRKLNKCIVLTTEQQDQLELSKILKKEQP